MYNEKKAPVRQAKYRGLTIDTKEWVYGVPYFLNIKEDDPEDCIDKACIITGADWDGTCGFMSPDNNCFIEVIPETVGQFTGRTDVNGVEIYEGDKVLHGESERFVEYRWTNFVLTRIEKTGTILLSFSDKPRVIGNIHEESDINSIEGKETKGNG